MASNASRMFGRSKPLRKVSGACPSKSRVTISARVSSSAVAVKAAKEQITSPGAVDSGFPAWLAARQGRGHFVGYDPEAAFATLERRLEAGEPFPAAEP